MCGSIWKKVSRHSKFRAKFIVPYSLLVLLGAMSKKDDKKQDDENPDYESSVDSDASDNEDRSGKCALARLELAQTL